MSPRLSKTTAVLVTALPVEFDALKRLLGEGTTEVGEQGMRYVVAIRADANVVLFATGAGNVNAAIEVERAIARYNPRYLFFVGIAGGLKDVRLGDVVAATKIYNYESGKSAKEFLARPQMGESSYYLVQLAQDVARDKEWNGGISGSENPSVLVGAIVAGEKVIVSLEAHELETIRSRYSDALALEMEGYGVLRVAYSREQIRMIVIRGISDLLAGKNKSDAAGSQARASANAANFTLSMLDCVLQETRPVNAAMWAAFERLLVELYPTGPTHNQLWNRAGGDLATLHLGQTGKAAWHSALQQLRNGGGGMDITFVRLLDSVFEDYPNNPDIISIRESRR
jgi:adenosylhomocysteine nucleosidase